MRLPEKCFEWQAKGWSFGITLCPGTWAVIVWWDGNPYSLAIALPFVRIWCERDGGKVLAVGLDNPARRDRQAGVPVRSGA